MKFKFTHALALTFFCFLSFTSVRGVRANDRASAKKPNIIFIMADDLGFNQLGCYGDTPIKTPNLDRLAEDGIRFTQAYAGNTVCSPSRVSLFTGRDGRLMHDNSNKVQLRDIDVTIAHVLKHAGLANSVWTSDKDRDSRVAEAMVAGNSWIDARDVFAQGVPYGSVNKSGVGGGVLSIETLLDYYRNTSVVRPPS